MKDLSGLEIKDYFRILWYRRWYFIIVFALVSIGGVFYAKHQPDVYSSVARVAVDAPLSSVSRSILSVNERKEIIREQLSSRTFLERMIQQTGAYGFGDSRDFVIERALDNVRRNIRIENTSDRMFMISFRSTSPEMAQNVTRQFTEQLIRASRQSIETRVKTVDKFIDEELAKVEEKLKEQSEKISEFKMRNAGKLPEQTATNMSTISGYRAQLVNADNTIMQMRNSRETLEYRYDERKRVNEKLAQIPSPPGASPVITRDSSPEERELSQKMANLLRYEDNLAQAQMKYTENHPDIARYKREIGRLEQEIEEARAKLKQSPVVDANADDTETPFMTRADIEEEAIEKEFRRQISIIDADIAKWEKERAELQKLINDYQFRVSAAPTLEQELNDLQREETFLKKQYETYAAQKLSSGMTSAVETGQENEVYRVVDDANLPTFPDWPNRAQLILIGFGVGFIAGIALAFVRELLDTTINNEEEAKKVFNLPVLAAIPIAPKRKKKTELRKTA